MKPMKPEKLAEMLREGLGDGDLMLMILCTKCNTQFEIGREGAALAMITGASFLEYVKYVQSSKCVECENKDK